ncbi:IclR family transcriptional regulator [Microbispora oryzae]|uniref:IclR family transcriptional regulator n=1 Tax=Microbispora oryzae TaxID=2806554 RepID=UPI0027DD5A33|nr:IclR family transcriptional regulator [Microbispora oryzae]
MIQSVERAALILRALGSGAPRLGVTEIAERVGLAKPTVHGLLRTLAACELVVQDADTGKYALGPAVLQLGNAYLDGSELRARSLLWAGSLAERVNEAVWVGTLSGSRVIVLHHVFRPDDVVQILEVGAAIPWHACALGHAIVAHDPRREELLAGELVPLTGLTRTSRPDLERALAAVREDGYAIEDQEAALGDAGIAAPVFGRDGSVAGAVGAIGPAERLLDRERREDVARAVRETARAVSRDLGAPRSAGHRDPAAFSAPMMSADDAAPGSSWPTLRGPR